MLEKNAAAPKQLAAYLLPTFVLLILGIYVVSSTTGVSSSVELGFLVMVALGVLGIVGALEVGRRLDPKFESLRARAGTTFGICAFAIFVMMVVIQTGSRLLWREPRFRAGAGDHPDAEAMLETAFLGVNAVQATMDVAFDIFYCLAVILFSSLMIRHPAFGRVIGAFGMIAGGSLLLLNLLTFPIPPAEAGLIDLGPLTGAWWVAVVLLLVRADRREPIEKSDR